MPFSRHQRVQSVLVQIRPIAPKVASAQAADALEEHTVAAVSPESVVDAVVRQMLQKVSEQKLLTSPHIALVQEAASPPAPVDASGGLWLPQWSVYHGELVCHRNGLERP